MRTLLLIAALGLSSVLSAPHWGEAQADEIRLQDNPPDRHVVGKGDTLWDISEKFLKDPWKWPEVWGFNKEQIKNPHLIYPGDVVLLSMEGGRPRLSLQSSGRFNETVKLSPSIRGEPIIIKEAGIPAIPVKAITPLLSKGGVGDPTDLVKAPMILGSSDARVMFGPGDRVYASKAEADIVDWRVVRLGQALKNPDNPKEVLAYEMIHIADARTETPGDPQVVRILRTEQEVLERDRLVPAWKSEPPQYMPHAPEKPIQAKVVAALGGPLYAGTWMTLVLDKGTRDGLEDGHVLALFRAGRSVADPKCIRAEKIAFLAGGGRGHAEDCKQDKNDKTALPETRNGLAFVYRVFNKVSYALVMKGIEPVTVGDIARNP
ncbi:MAG: LysM peptidoglycan-binding domain-containing protein [Pseudomonadota bacterium]|nr:LysM peptidoglycan-binding domain-containing protein [Pseudomonadota bacterium]